MPQRRRKGWALAAPIVSPGAYGIVRPADNTVVDTSPCLVTAAHLIATKYPDHWLGLADPAGDLRAIDLHIDGPTC
jgi:hypothetical protein